MAQRGSVSKKKTPRSEENPPVRWRKYQYFLLIVCEDSKTEPAYFETFREHFPEETFFLRTVGTGRSAKGVLEKAIEEKENLASEARKNIDEVWCVFDKDDADLNTTTKQNFETAFTLAKQHKFNVAYSNEVFELWFLLHYQEVDWQVAIARSEIYRQLEQNIRNNTDFQDFIYEHGKPSIVEAILRTGNEPDAIRRSNTLCAAHKEKPPIEANPSTTVHVLVQSIRSWIDYYSYTP